MLSHSLDFLSHFSLQKCIRFNPEASVWVAKQRILCTLNQSLKDVLNYGLFQPASNGRDGKFLDEERLLREYPQPVNKGVPSLEVFLDEKSEIMLYCSDADYTVNCIWGFCVHLSCIWETAISKFELELFLSEMPVFACRWSYSTCYPQSLQRIRPFWRFDSRTFVSWGHRRCIIEE